MTKSRRQFLGEMNCAAVGSTSMLSSLLNLQLTGRLAAENTDETVDDYRAIVCVFLSGGNDSFNMLAPISGEAQTEYLASRGTAGLAANNFLPLSESLPDGRLLGLNKEMAAVHQLHLQEKVAFACNVGSLVEPTTPEAVSLGNAVLPLGLYSHSDQSTAWQSTLPENRNARSGWGGRLADILSDLNTDQRVSMGVSLSGANLFQVGSSSVPFTIGRSGVPSIKNWNTASFAHRRMASEGILNQEYQDAFQRTLITKKKDAIEAGAFFQEAYLSGEQLNTQFDESDNFSSSLRSVAKTIAARTSLGARRQVFFVQYGGWDHHGSLAEHPSMLGRLSQGIGNFYESMTELGLENQVTLFTASDFGRTLSPNGSGTDHAWGGNHLVVGGAVKGGIYGEYPSLALGDILDVGRGRLLPTTSVDEYYADLALWMGVSPEGIGTVLPNLYRFHDIGDGIAPLGYLS